MYPISIDLRARFERGERKRTRIILSNANGTQIITEEDIKADSFSVDRYCATGNKIEIGSAVSSEFSVVLNNHDGRFDDIVFEGSDLCVDVGFDWSDGNYVRCGFFTVDEPPRAFSTISIKALDYMMRYDKEIDHTKLSDAYYTPETLVRKISELCGVEVSSEINFDALPNSAESLSIPTTATTYRQLLQWVAEITATCAYIGWDGNLRMSWFVDTPVNITPTLRYTGDVHENDIEITGVTVKTQDATATSGGDKYPLLIEGNGFVYSQTEQDRANNIGAVVNGFTYRPYECTCLPMPYLFPLDRITYTDKSGKEISTVVTNHRFGLNSTSILAAQGETQQKKNYASQRGLTKAEVDSAIAEAMKNFDSSTEHFYVKYSAYEKGRDTDGNVSMFDKVQADTAYLGTCATDSKSPPESPEDYNWVKIRPEDGEPGRSVVSVKTQYYRSTSSTTQRGGSWLDTMPEWVEDTYLWKREVVTYENPAGTVNGTAILDTSWDVLGDIKEDASDAKEKASAVDVASKELNKTLAGALGLHLTEQTIAGSVVRYYHTNPTLSASKSGDTILVLNANGFGVCKSGWNNGNPQFSYGTTFDGKAVWDILTANKISADLIEAGKLKSVATARTQTTLDLDTGILTLKSGDSEIELTGFPVKNSDESDEFYNSLNASDSSRNPGLKMYSSDDDTFFRCSSGEFVLISKSYAEANEEYMKEFVKWMMAGGLLGGKPAPTPPSEENMISANRNLFFATNIQCRNLSFSPDDGNNYVNMADFYSRFVLAQESITAMQERIGELEAALGQQHTHTNASAVHENVVEATCTSGGSYDSVVYCATCPEEISRTKITTSALGHSWRDATCTSPKTCIRCGATQGSALGHTDSNGDGYCDRCGIQTGTPTTYYTIKTAVSPAGAGTVTGAGTYEDGTVIQPTATAIGNYKITGWIIKNDDTGEENRELENAPVKKIAVSVNYNMIITALFESTGGGGSDSSQDTITEGVTKTINVAASSTNANATTIPLSDFTLVKFTPTVSGTYQFEATNGSSSDTYGRLYNTAQSQILAEDDDSGTGGRHFKFTYDCTEGTTYYVAVRFWASGSEGTVDLLVTRLSSSGGGSGGSGETVEITTNVHVKVYKNGVDVTNSDMSYSFNVGDTVRLEAIPRDGYNFSSWLCGGTIVSAQNPFGFVVTTDKAGYYMPIYS